MYRGSFYRLFIELRTILETSSSPANSVHQDDTLTAITGKYKLGARSGKYKLGARVGKYKLVARTEGQAKGRGPGNTSTL